jgi:hypothetical protein
MISTINGITYDTDKAFPFDDSCLGRTDTGYLWQMLLISKTGNFFMLLSEAPENLSPNLASITKGEIISLTKELAIERFETRLFDKSPGTFKKFAVEEINEYLSEEEE